MRIASLLDSPNIGDAGCAAGTPARVVGIAEGMAVVGADVTLAVTDRGTFTSNPFKMPVHLVDADLFHDGARLATYVEQVVGATAVIDCEAEHLAKTVSLYREETQIIYDMHDDDAKVARSLGETDAVIDARREAQEFAIRSATATLVSTEHERALASQHIPADRVIWMPNGCAPQAVSPKSPTMAVSPPDLVFLGNLLYPPNERAAQFIARDLMPRLAGRGSSTRALIIGQGTAAIDSHPSVEAIGFVEDLLQTLAQSRIGLAPLDVGSGAKMKVRDYCRAGLPVLTTAEGAAGMPPSEAILIHDNLEDWDRIITDLLNDPPRLQRMSQAAIAVAAELAWDRLASQLLERLSSLPPSAGSVFRKTTPPRLMTPRWVSDNAAAFKRPIGKCTARVLPANVEAHS